tara:strand:+ start:7050 stop:7235 length:186 start_codon:yes stop_codon:yes gene_type:complete
MLAARNSALDRLYRIVLALAGSDFLLPSQPVVLPAGGEMGKSDGKRRIILIFVVHKPYFIG